MFPSNYPYADPALTFPAPDLAQAQRLIDAYIAQNGNTDVQFGYTYVSGSATAMPQRSSRAWHCTAGQAERNCLTSPQRSQVPTTVSPAGVSMRKWCLHSIATLIIAYWAAYVRWFGQDYVG